MNQIGFAIHSNKPVDTQFIIYPEIQSSTLMWDTTATRQMLKSAIVLAATDQPSSHVEFGFV